MNKLSTAAQNAKTIRTQLKEAFPATKFKVLTDNYSGGSSIDVYWMDGATAHQVEAITCQFSRVDRCTYSGEILSGGNSYVFSHRNYSADVLRAEVETFRNWTMFAEVDFDAIEIDESGSRNYIKSEPSHRPYDNGGYRDLSDEVYRQLKTKDLTATPEASLAPHLVSRSLAKPPLRGIEDNEIIMEYLFPEDAVATDCGATVTENPEKDGVEVKFDRKPDSATLDALKSNGFRYSRNLNIWYAKRTPQTLTVARNLASISIPTPVVESTTLPDFSYLLGAANEQLAQEVAQVKAEEIEHEISAPRQQVLALMPAVEIEESEAISPVVAAIEPEVIEDPNLSVSEFRQAANSGKVISLFAFATAIRREQTPVPAVKPSYQVVDTFDIEPVAIEKSKPTFEVIRTLAASGLTAW